jgi:hypothetical protein
MFMQHRLPDQVIRADPWDRLRDLGDVKDLFEDAELRRRVAELIVRSARGANG